MVKQLCFVFITFLISGCLHVPVHRLNYLKTDRDSTKKVLTKGCYYQKIRVWSNTKNEIERVTFLVFYNNGLLRHATFDVSDSITIEDEIILSLKKFKHRAESWGDYEIIGDSIYLENIYSIGMAPRIIDYENGVIENDTTIIILNSSRFVDSFTTKTYKCLPFSQPPDSTGYLYDKLQKKKVKDLKRKNRK